MTPPIQFLTDFAKDLTEDRKTGAQNQTQIIEGYSRLLELREDAAQSEGQLIGVAKILDNLWDNSYYSMGPEASKRIEREMVYYFGENWTTYMYDFMTRDGKSIPGRHPEPIPTIAQITPTTNKETR